MESSQSRCAALLLVKEVAKLNLTIKTAAKGEEPTTLFKVLNKQLDSKKGGEETDGSWEMGDGNSVKEVWHEK